MQIIIGKWKRKNDYNINKNNNSIRSSYKNTKINQFNKSLRENDTAINTLIILSSINTDINTPIITNDEILLANAKANDSVKP